MMVQDGATVAQSLLDQMDTERATTSRIQAAADALVASGVVPKRVVIEVDDGVARVTYVSPGVEVQIIDHDDPESGPSPIVPLTTDADDPCRLDVCQCVEETDCGHDWLESTYSCVRCDDDRCGGECCDREVS